MSVTLLLKIMSVISNSDHRRDESMHIIQQ
jgi:hypothetical protein